MVLINIKPINVFYECFLDQFLSLKKPIFQSRIIFKMIFTLLTNSTNDFDCYFDSQLGI